MIAAQYSIGLPADYDMGIIRRRVAEKGAAFDRLPGLGFKAFLISERAAGAPANRYAPFYLWNEVGALWDFIAGPGFDGVAASFGRPPVLTWLPLALAVRSGLRREAVRHALGEEVPIARPADLAALRAAERRSGALALAADRAIVLSLVAASIERWSLMRFTLRYEPPSMVPAGADAWEVLHLSAPGLDGQAPEGF